MAWPVKILFVLPVLLFAALIASLFGWFWDIVPVWIPLTVAWVTFASALLAEHVKRLRAELAKRESGGR